MGLTLGLQLAIRRSTLSSSPIRRCSNDCKQAVAPTPYYRQYHFALTISTDKEAKSCKQNGLACLHTSAVGRDRATHAIQLSKLNPLTRTLQGTRSSSLIGGLNCVRGLLNDTREGKGCRCYRPDEVGPWCTGTRVYGLDCPFALEILETRCRLPAKEEEEAEVAFH